MNRDDIFPLDGSFKLRTKTISADSTDKLDDAFNAWIDASVDNKSTAVVSTQFQACTGTMGYPHYSVQIVYRIKK